MTPRKAALPLIPLLLLLTALACGGSAPPASTPENVPPPGLEAPPPLDADAPSEALSAIRLSAGLGQLDNYQMTLRIAFGPDGSQESITFTNDWQRSPSATSLLIQASDEEDFLLTAQDGLLYQLLPDAGCLIQSDTADNPAFERFMAGFYPDQVVGEIRGAKFVGDVERPDGTMVAHYQFDPAAWAGHSGLTALAGDLYVDRQLGIVVALTAVATQGSLAEFAAMSRAGFQLNYELTPNRVAPIDRPAGCPDLWAGNPYPLLPDAHSLNFADNVLTFMTDASLPEATASYREAMDAAGWLSNDEEDFVAPTGMVITYRRGGETISVSLFGAENEAGTRILIDP
jgi:hypothetical protein